MYNEIGGKNKTKTSMQILKNEVERKEKTHIE